LIEEDRRRGHIIVQGEGEIPKGVDLYVVGNFVDNFNVGYLLSFLANKEYINMEHDLRAPHRPYYKMFSDQAIINIFRSPLHANIIEKLNGKIKHFLHPNCMPPMFCDGKLKRKPPNQLLFVGDYNWEKGYQEMVDWLSEHSDDVIWHYGGGFKKIHPQMKEMGFVPYEQMPQLYNTFSSLIFLPHYPEACCRVMGEAYLCKVPNVITNDLNGFSSYGWTLDDYDEVRIKLINAGEIWWERVEGYLDEYDR